MDEIQRNMKKTKITIFILRVILMIAVVLVILPIIWTFISSLKTNNDISVNPWKLPELSNLQFINYANAWQKANIGSNLFNSIYVTFLGMAIMMILVIPASYALGRYKGKVITPLRSLFMAGLFIQKNYLVVPLFVLLKTFHMLDSRTALSIVYASASLPFYIYLLSGFVSGIDNAYVEAAEIDGCSYSRTMWSIVVPMCKPGLVTVGMFSFMDYWNEYILATQFISTATRKTLPVGLKNVMEVSKYATDWGALFAAMVIVMIPTMIFYVLVQKKLTSGLSLGGLKG